MKEGIILFAHGSHSAAWAKPFRNIKAAVKRGRPRAVVVLAYLEINRPSLPEAIKRLAAEGVRSIRVVPLFLGSGRHITRDLPRLARPPRGVKIMIEAPIGEQPRVLRAIAGAIAR